MKDSEDIERISGIGKRGICTLGLEEVCIGVEVACLIGDSLFEG